jgi:DNA polymerase-3 subunit delta'
VRRQHPVADIRRVPRFLGLTAAEGGWRVVVIDEAELLEPEAQNALLKTLEEPPPRAVLLLVSAAPQRLLPTLRSRCRRLVLAPLPVASLDALLGTWLPDMGEADRAALARLAAGSPGQAGSLGEGDGLVWQREVEAVLGGLPLPVRAAHELGDRLAARRDGGSFVLFMALLRRTLAAAVRDAAQGGPTPPWLAPRALADWASVWETLGRIVAETEALNLDRKQAVLSSLGLLAPPA